MIFFIKNKTLKMLEKKKKRKGIMAIKSKVSHAIMLMKKTITPFKFCTKILVFPP